MPVGRRQRVFKFKHGSDEQRVTLHYGSGPATISIGARELEFEASAADDGHFDLTLDGARSHIVSVIEGHELYLRTRHGRFDLHWVDPFAGVLKRIKCKVGDIVGEGVELAEVEPSA